MTNREPAAFLLVLLDPALTLLRMALADSTHRRLLSTLPVPVSLQGTRISAAHKAQAPLISNLLTAPRPTADVSRPRSQI